VDAHLREIGFSAALVELHGLLGKRVMVNVTGREAFSVAFVARLDYVESLPTEGSSVMLHFEHGEVLDLDLDLQAFLGGDRSEGLRWLEFWMGAGAPTAVIEAVHLPDG
jgi:hypothetical protein